MEDYSVRVMIRFRDTVSASRKKSLITNEERKALFQVNIKNTIMNDSDLRFYIDFDSLFFRYNDSYVLFSYMISCHDENEDEAESFAKFLVTDKIKEAFSSQGYEFIEIDAYEESFDTEWYNQKKYVINSLFDDV